MVVGGLSLASHVLKKIPFRSEISNACIRFGKIFNLQDFPVTSGTLFPMENALHSNRIRLI